MTSSFFFRSIPLENPVIDPSAPITLWHGTITGNFSQFLPNPLLKSGTCQVEFNIKVFELPITIQSQLFFDVGKEAVISLPLLVNLKSFFSWLGYKVKSLQTIVVADYDYFR